MLMKNGLGDLWMPCVCFLGLLASLGFGLHKVNLLLFAECATVPCTITTVCEDSITQPATPCVLHRPLAHTVSFSSVHSSS